MMEPESTSQSPEAPRPPLFTLDLGANGGLFAPTNASEMRDWVEAESSFWNWIWNSPGIGNHRGSLDQAAHGLQQAVSAARDAVKFEAQSNLGGLQERVQQVERSVREAYVSRQWPHRSVPMAKRAESLRLESPQAAVAYLYAMIPPTQGIGLDARDMDVWRGFFLGMLERADAERQERGEVQAQVDALADLRARTEDLVGNKRLAIEALQRSFEETSSAISEALGSQSTAFETFIVDSRKAHEDALTAHERAMSDLRTTFGEAMKLRGPVSYWEAKAARHALKATSLMKWMFGSMAALAVVLLGIAAWVFATLDAGKPDAWKIAVLVLVGVLGVWAVRLVVRMFLSDTHLATDAEERVTMVMTYLALLEGGKMPSDEDRKLVLGPLFRPATDGLVKDESLPHPMLELFTRATQR